MHTANAIMIHADKQTVYDLGSAVERWPDILPHYRWVHVLEDHGDWRLVEMAARRDFFPVRWVAEQRCSPDVPHIAFRHVGGVTRGMEVEWVFTETPNGVLVEIRHELKMNWPLVGGPVADWIVGPVFVANIASKTLRTIKQIAEGQASDAPEVRG